MGWVFVSAWWLVQIRCAKGVFLCCMSLWFEVSPNLQLKILFPFASHSQYSAETPLFKIPRNKALKSLNISRHPSFQYILQNILIGEGTAAKTAKGEQIVKTNIMSADTPFSFQWMMSGFQCAGAELEWLCLWNSLSYTCMNRLLCGTGWAVSLQS